MRIARNALQRLVVTLGLATLVACAATTAGRPPVRHADINGARLAYVDQGRGLPVVFLHGAISDMRYWEHWREAVAGRHRYIALTQRYFGNVPRSEGDPKFSLGLHADDVAAFIRHLDAGPVVLVGQSYGASVALAAAARHGELVRAVFVNEPGIGSLVTDPADKAALADDRPKVFAPVVAAMKEGDNAKAVRAMINGVNDLPDAFDRVSPATQQMLLDNAHSLQAMFSAASPPPIECAQLSRLAMPALVARGEATRPFFRVQADAAARCLRNAEVLIVPRGRHSWPSAEPELYRTSLLAFLDSL